MYTIIATIAILRKLNFAIITILAGRRLIQGSGDNPGTKEAHPETKEAHPRTGKAHSGAEEAHPGAIEAHLQPMSAHHTVEQWMLTLEPRKLIVEL
jgi:hypothetical protein